MLLWIIFDLRVYLEVARKSRKGTGKQGRHVPISLYFRAVLSDAFLRFFRSWSQILR